VTDPREPKLGDPADRAADGQFGAAGSVVHRAGYGPPDAKLLRVLAYARKGFTLNAGEGAAIVAHYESGIRAALDILESDPDALGFVGNALRKLLPEWREP
jgi:hypothetical protein